MKKYTLFILISLMACNALCLTQEEKDKIYEAIVAEAKMSQCFRLSPRSDIHIPNFEHLLKAFDETEDHKITESFIAAMYKDLSLIHI